MPVSLILEPVAFVAAQFLMFGFAIALACVFVPVAFVVVEVEVAVEA